MQDRIVNVVAYLPGIPPKGATSRLVEVAGWVSDEELPHAIARAARHVLEKTREGEPLPYPWCWGDCLETLDGEPSQMDLFKRFGVRVLRAEPNVLLLDNDEIAISDLED